MNQQLSCQIHNEQVKYLGKDVKSNQLIGFCFKCVPTAQVPLMLIEDVEKQIDEHKSKLLKLIDQEKEDNTDILNQLLSFLFQFKKEQIKKLDQLIQSLQEEVSLINKSFANRYDLLLRFTTLDLNTLIDLFEQKGREQNLEKKKHIILTQLSDIESKTFFYDSSNILSQFPAQKYFRIFKTISDSNQNQGLKCKKHSQDIVALDIKEQNYCEKLLCLKCISEQPRQVITIEDANKSWNNHHQKFKEAHIQYKQLLEQTAEVLKIHLSKSFEKIKRKQEQALIFLESIVNQKINLIQQQIDVIQKKQLNLFSQTDLQQLLEISDNSNKIFLVLEEEILNIDNFLKTYQTSKTQNISLSKLFSIIVLVQKLLKSNETEYAQYKNLKYIIEYKNLPESSTKLVGQCQAIAINTNGNLLAAGCNKKINIYKFNLGELKLLEQLDNSENVYCLQFIKNQNCFISVGDDKQIKIWVQLQGSWSLNQTLKGHTNQIKCLAINQKGDQIISSDKSIRIWKLKNKAWSNCQTIPDHKSSVYSLSLNDSEDQMVSCDYNGLLLVMAQINGQQQWSVIQQIQLQLGKRLCFLTDNQFSFQPSQSQFLLIFEFDSNTKQYTQSKVVQMKDDNQFQECNWLFPQQYIKSKEILVNKYKNHLNIVKKLDYGEFKVDQSIQMNSNDYYGTMSNDGEYLFISLLQEIKLCLGHLQFFFQISIFSMRQIQMYRKFKIFSDLNIRVQQQQLL